MTKPPNVAEADVREEAKALARTMRALGNYRRAMLFRWLAHQAAPVRFKVLQEKSGIPAASLSKIVHKMEDAGLLTLTIGLDRSLTVAVNNEGLGWLAGFLLTAYKRVENAPAAATTAEVGNGITSTTEPVTAASA